MIQKKNLQQRQQELQALIATPTGREEIQTLVSRYAAQSGNLSPARKSAVTFILVHERIQGLITG